MAVTVRSRGNDLFMLMFLGLLVLFGAHSLFAQAEEFIVPIEVTITDGRTTGREMVNARLHSDGSLQALSAQDLAERLLAVSQSETLSATLERDWLSVKELVAAGLDVTYKPADLSAEVRVPPSLQPVRAISGRGSRRIYPGEVVPPARFSAALPFYVSGQQIAVGASVGVPGGETRHRLGVEALPSLTYAGTVLSGMINTRFIDNQGMLESWEAAVSRDLFQTIRVTAGTTRIDSYGFQTGQPVVGVGVERRAGLAETPVLADRFQVSFEIETESAMEIYLNDRLIRTKRLLPGRYSVSDLPLIPGLNNIRIVITDDMGEKREIVDRIAHASDLLSPGSSEYGFSVGAVEDDFEDVVGRSYYRRGLVEGATGVVYAEATAQDQMLGTRLTTSSPIGILFLGGAGGYATSRTDSDVEYAVESGYRFRAPSARWIPSLGISLLHRSAGFYAPGHTQDSRPTRVPPLVAGATISQALPLGFSLVAGGRYTMAGSGGADQASVFAYLGAQIGRSLSVRTALNVDHMTDDPQIRGRISLAFGIGRGRYRSTGSLPEEVIDMSMTQNFDVGEATGSTGVAIDRIEMPDGGIGSLAGNLRITHPRGEAAGAVRVSPGETLVDDDLERREARVRVGSGVYFADGVLGVGRPTTGSFAVIGADSSVPSATILVNPRGEHAEARSGLLGAAVLSSVPDYHGKPIRIEVPDLPIDFALDWSDVVFESAYRSGVGLRVGGGRLLYGSGRLTDSEDVPVALRVIRVIDAGEIVYTGYTDENGTFLVYDLIPGEYRLRIGETGPEARFVLPPDAEPPVDLGTLRLRSETGGES